MARLRTRPDTTHTSHALLIVLLPVLLKIYLIQLRAPDHDLEASARVVSFALTSVWPVFPALLYQNAPRTVTAMVARFAAGRRTRVKTNPRTETWVHAVRMLCSVFGVLNQGGVQLSLKNMAFPVAWGQLFLQWRRWLLSNPFAAPLRTLSTLRLFIVNPKNKPTTR